MGGICTQWDATLEILPVATTCIEIERPREISQRKTDTWDILTHTACKKHREQTIVNKNSSVDDDKELK